MFLAAGTMCHRGMTGSGEKAIWLWPCAGFLAEPPVHSLSVVWLAGAGLTAAGGEASGALAEFAVPATERPRSAFETWMPICAAFCEPLTGGSGMLACAAGDMGALGSENSCAPGAAIAEAAALASGGVELTEIPVIAEVMVAPNRYAPFDGQGWPGQSLPKLARGGPCTRYRRLYS